jgi:uncharacterized protein YqgC (DUF456 family)
MKDDALALAMVAELEARRDLWRALAEAVAALVALAKQTAGRS